MITLPALDEADKVAYARALLAQWGELLTAGAGQGFSRTILKTYALTHPFNLSNIIEGAKAGWDDAHLALTELIAEYAGSGRQLPPQLAAYTIDVLNPNLPPRPRGPKKSAQVTRKILIVALVSILVERFPGTHAKRNRQSRAPVRALSACAIVARALEEEPGLPKMGERAIEGIWEDFRDVATRWRDAFNAAASVPEITP